MQSTDNILKKYAGIEAPVVPSFPDVPADKAFEKKSAEGIQNIIKSSIEFGKYIYFFICENI